MRKQTKAALSLFLLIVLTIIPFSVVLAVEITWATGATIDTDIKDAVEVLIEAEPPTELTTIYAVTDVTETSVTTWLVSVIALDDVTGPPYEDWNVEENGVWMGTVLVTLSGTYTGEYYDPVLPPMGGGDELRFPWRPGTKAQYGMRGLHNAGYQTNLLAVDFVGGDNLGSGIMPPYAYAAADGVITWVCKDDTSVAIKVLSGMGEFIYAHLQDNANLEQGEAVYQARPIGSLVYGSFDDSCGWASQQNTNYHLHFGFEANDNRIGGCIINTSTGIWTCGEQQVGVNGWLIENLNYIPPDDDDGDNPVPDLNGGSFWDGIIAGLDEITRWSFDSFMVEANEDLNSNTVFVSFREFVLSDLETANNLLPFVINFTPFLIVGILILTMEIGRFFYAIYQFAKSLLPFG